MRPCITKPAATCQEENLSMIRSSKRHLVDVGETYSEHLGAALAFSANLASAPRWPARSTRWYHGLVTPDGEPIHRRPPGENFEAPIAFRGGPSGIRHLALRRMTGGRLRFQYLSS
jgi:hypothetical protein